MTYRVHTNSGAPRPWRTLQRGTCGMREASGSVRVNRML
jgi:hypothetical protein